jgi:hypothetical protein
MVIKNFFPFILGVAFTFLLLLSTGLVSANSLPGVENSIPALGQAGSDDESTPPTPLNYSPSSITATNSNLTTVYFAPTDNNSTATYINLYNTSPVTDTVVLQAFNKDGGLLFNANINVGAYDLVRVISDGLPTYPPTSWQNNVFLNLTDFSTFAKMQLPAGVKAEVFMVFNPTGEIDPRADQGTTPIRLSSDPLSIFLPSIQR